MSKRPNRLAARLQMAANLLNSPGRVTDRPRGLELEGAGYRRARLEMVPLVSVPLPSTALLP